MMDLDSKVMLQSDFEDDPSVVSSSERMDSAKLSGLVLLTMDFLLVLALNPVWLLLFRSNLPLGK